MSQAQFETEYEKSRREAFQRMNKLGEIGKPIVCNVPEKAWSPTGDFDCDDAGNPTDAMTRLSVVVKCAGVIMRLEALQVNTDLSAVNKHLEVDVNKVIELAGLDGDEPRLLEIDNRQYLLAMYPMGR